MNRYALTLIPALHLALFANPPDAGPPQTNIASFELVWSTLNDRYWDRSMAGLDWKSIHDRYLRQVQGARTTEQAREAIESMIRLLPSSHLAIIPGSVYHRASSVGASKAAQSSQDKEDEDAAEDAGSSGLTVIVLDQRVVIATVEPASSADRAGVHAGWILSAVNGAQTRSLFAEFDQPAKPAGDQLVSQIVQDWLSGPIGMQVTLTLQASGQEVTRTLERQQPAGALVRFGNLPPERVRMDHRMLPGSVGYIRLNLFLDPMTVMPEFEKAIAELHEAPGIVLDIRDNPGGLGIMAMGIAGWFVSDEGEQLGSMIGRDESMNFIINPRLQSYKGRLAVLVNAGSASTSEILAQGLHDLGRARIFGTRTAGAALPSVIILLPNGDRFQYPDANYTSMKGRVLEGNGVQPDVVIAPTIPALLAGRDLPLEAAVAWCKEK